MLILMRIGAGCLMVGLVLVAPALADDLAGGDKTLRISKIDPETCRQLAPYIASGEADYKPGTAADGSAVAPADLGDGYVYEPRSFYRFPVEIEPLETTTEPYRHSKLGVADVTFDVKTGRVTVDGQDVSGGNRALSEACATHAGALKP